MVVHLLSYDISRDRGSVGRKRAMVMDNSKVPIFILAGGLGTRLKEHTEFRPKPMVEIGGKPILWHILRWYGKCGFKRFIICAGFKSEIIKEYFLNYDAMHSDFTVDLKTRGIVYHDAHHSDDWTVTVVFTGDNTMTGGRIGIATERYLGDADNFGVTYGDGVTNADLDNEFAFHLAHGKIGTVLAVNPPSRFGELVPQENLVRRFSEKPELATSWISGGYFFFRREFTNYLSSERSLVLENEPLTQLARDHQLCLYRHKGFWASMDTQRDRDVLDGLWQTGHAPWAVSDSAK
jgi:glucose-1-phosphate cytidylyltransferase